MSYQPKILAFAGSSRLASFNKKLVKFTAEIVKEIGAEVNYIDLLDYPMPIFNEDLEQKTGLPAKVKEFKLLLQQHQGFLISCPEYNGSITPLLKNAIDWASRSELNEQPLSCFQGKVAGLLATSPGSLGGIRGLAHVRAILAGIGVIVIPKQKAIPSAHQAFDASGRLKDEKQIDGIRALAQQLVEVTSKLA
ncbi:MAG: NADPH-dependent oxidoreductase [Cyanobacteria bacterium J083]|nr:MAG: NADPH-dependent oxidoreductase [Cyanobacteria bacterium J083]